MLLAIDVLDLNLELGKDGLSVNCYHVLCCSLLDKWCNNELCGTAVGVDVCVIWESSYRRNGVGVQSI